MTTMAILEDAIPVAFSIPVDVDKMEIEWAFSRHHLIYAATGLVKIETENASWRLPPSRAVWMHSGSCGNAISHGPVTGVSIFFADDFVIPNPFQCRIFNISSMVREMIFYATRWGPDRPLSDPVADRFFLSLADICQELVAQPDALHLPKAQTIELQQVLDYTVKHLHEPLKFTALAQMANVSERTLARRFATEIFMTWRQFHSRARMIQAMDLLSQGNNVTTTALEVGFQNVGAFSTAFQKFSAFTPTQYQKQFLS